MDLQKNLLTKEGKEKLEKELRSLIDIERPKVIKSIQEAREQGDLSENADYEAAKARQGEIERRISEIKGILDHFEIINDEKNNDNRRIKVGSKVTITILSSGKDETYTIVGEVEADPDNDKISNLSPLAKSILNKVVGATVEVHGVEDPYKIKIKKVV